MIKRRKTHAIPGFYPHPTCPGAFVSNVPAAPTSQKVVEHEKLIQEMQAQIDQLKAMIKKQNKTSNQ